MSGRTQVSWSAADDEGRIDYTGRAVEFPGLLGVVLYRLRTWMREAPLAALGPLLGFLAVDIAIDIVRGDGGSAAVTLVIAAPLALSVSAVAQQSQPGVSGGLLLVLGAVSALGASALLSVGVTRAIAPEFMMGMRHLAVAGYAWAAIAAEPPPRRRPELRPVRT